MSHDPACTRIPFKYNSALFDWLTMDAPSLIIAGIAAPIPIDSAVSITFIGPLFPDDMTPIEGQKMTNRSPDGRLLVCGRSAFPVLPDPATMRTHHADESLLFPFPAASPFAELRFGVGGDEFWERRLESLRDDAACGYSVHLAVMVNPHLQRLLDGQKTGSSRGSDLPTPALGMCPHRGRLILLKKSGGQVMGICQAGQDMVLPF